MKSLSHFPGKLTWYKYSLLGALGLGERLEGCMPDAAGAGMSQGRRGTYTLKARKHRDTACQEPGSWLPSLHRSRMVLGEEQP